MENKAVIYISGVIGEDIVLLDIMRQFKSYVNPTSVEVIIDSVGGSVDVGQSMYSYLRNLKLPVRTVAKRAYSIASVVFMAGDERVVERGEDKLMIHFPFVMNATGDAETLDGLSKELKAIESEFEKFYSTYTGIDPDTVKTLLKNETFLSGDDAFSLGFATIVEVPLAAVAFYDNKEEEDLTLKDKNFIMKNAEKLINALKTFVGTEGETPEIVSLVLQDANGVEITFPDVAEDAMPEIGDQAIVDGKPAEGEFISPDGSTWVFSGGALTEVRPLEEAAPEEEEAAIEEGDATVVAPTEDELFNQEVEKMLEELFAKKTAELIDTMTAKYSELSEENSKLSDELVAVKKLIGTEPINTLAEKQPKFKSSGSRAVDILNKRFKN